MSEIKDAPCARRAHFGRRGCMIFGGVHPACARVFSYLSLLCIGRVHGENSRRTVLGGVHPVGAQNKSLISDTSLSRRHEKRKPLYPPSLRHFIYHYQIPSKRCPPPPAASGDGDFSFCLRVLCKSKSFNLNCLGAKVLFFPFWFGKH